MPPYRAAQIYQQMTAKGDRLIAAVVGRVGRTGDQEIHDLLASVEGGA